MSFSPKTPNRAVILKKKIISKDPELLAGGTEFGGDVPVGMWMGDSVDGQGTPCAYDWMTGKYSKWRAPDGTTSSPLGYH